MKNRSKRETVEEKKSKTRNQRRESKEGGNGRRRGETSWVDGRFRGVRVAEDREIEG